MIRAWRNEILAVGALSLASLFVGLVVGRAWLLPALVLLAYFGWHLFNFLRLQIWVRQGGKLRPPLSFGVWEEVFDSLQRRELLNRRRVRRLIGSVSELKEAAAGLPDGLAIVSESGILRWFNPAAQKLLGLDWPGDLGTAITEVIAHPILEDDLAEGRSSRPLEVPSPANGAWMLSIQVTAPFGNQGERLLVARDITSIFRLQQVRRDFLASVSHELRTPITVFRGYLEALAEAAADDPQWRKPVAQMDQQAWRMQSLVDDLLTLSRLEMTDRPLAEAPVAVPEILTGIIAEALALSGEHKHGLHLRAEPGIWLLGDEAELYSAFSNLVFNAVRHTPPHTRVEIQWQGDSGGARFSVRDRGPGIAAHHLPRLSERFYRVETGRSRRSGGTGLGLAIVKRVLGHYDSELEITSLVGKGTTFSCQFPASLVHIEPATAIPKAG